MSDKIRRKKILVVRYHTIGDTIFTIPFFKKIREIEGNECQIDALSNNGNDFILRNISYINNVNNVDKILPMRYRNILKWIPQIRKYDEIYFLCCDKVLSIAAFLAGVKRRIGFDLKGVEYNYFLTERIQYKLDTHATNTYLGLLKLEVPDKKEFHLENIFENICNKTTVEITGGYITLQPVSTGRLKDWSMDKWKKVTEDIVQNTNLKVVILGSKNDSELVKELEISEKVINMCGKTTLEETVAIINSSEILIGIDSGLMHIAAVLEKKSILLHGSTSLTHWKPLNKNCKIISKNFPCSPCSYLMTEPHRPTCKDVDCMKAITEKDVISVYKELLNE